MTANPDIGDTGTARDQTTGPGDGFRVAVIHRRRRRDPEVGCRGDGGPGSDRRFDFRPAPHNRDAMGRGDRTTRDTAGQDFERAALIGADLGTAGKNIDLRTDARLDHVIAWTIEFRIEAQRLLFAHDIVQKKVDQVVAQADGIGRLFICRGRVVAAFEGIVGQSRIRIVDHGLGILDILVVVGDPDRLAVCQQDARSLERERAAATRDHGTLETAVAIGLDRQVAADVDLAVIVDLGLDLVAHGGDRRRCTDPHEATVLGHDKNILTIALTGNDAQIDGVSVLDPSVGAQPRDDLLLGNGIESGPRDTDKPATRSDHGLVDRHQTVARRRLHPVRTVGEGQHGRFGQDLDIATGIDVHAIEQIAAVNRARVDLVPAVHDDQGRSGADQTDADRPGILLDLARRTCADRGVATTGQVAVPDPGVGHGAGDAQLPDPRDTRVDPRPERTARCHNRFRRDRVDRNVTPGGHRGAVDEGLGGLLDQHQFMQGANPGRQPAAKHKVDGAQGGRVAGKDVDIGVLAGDGRADRTG